MKCERPDCDHTDCNPDCCVSDDFKLSSEHMLLIPACLLITIGICNASICCAITGLALASITYEIHKMKKTIKNCGCWY